MALAETLNLIFSKLDTHGIILRWWKGKEYDLNIIWLSLYNKPHKIECNEMVDTYFLLHILDKTSGQVLFIFFWISHADYQTLKHMVQIDFMPGNWKLIEKCVKFRINGHN